jgi:hypothetical protein
MNGRRIELSATQVIASLLAAVTGAVAASFLGVAGTIIGTAVMSVASTAVAAIYKGGLISSRERLRAAAEAARIAERVSGHRPARSRATEPGRELPATATGQGQSRAGATREDLFREDERRAATREGLSVAATRQELLRAAARQDRAAGPDDETQILPSVAFGTHRWDDADRANGRSGPAVEGAWEAGGVTQIVRRPGHEGAPGDVATQTMHQPHPGDGGAGRGGPAGGPGGAGRRDDDGAGRRDDDGAGTRDDGGVHAPGEARWRRPLVLAGIAAGIFLLAMAGITAFEAVAGKPLNALVGAGHGSGTTVGSIVGGSRSGTAPRHTSPARPSQGTSPTPRPSASPAGTPAPTPSPSPTPSGSPSPSPTASPSGAASPAPGSASPASAGP